MEFPIDKFGIFHVTNMNEINRMAEEYGKQRRINNSKLHEVAPEYSRGDIGDRVDILGVKAELLSIEFLKENNIEYQALDIVAERPIKSADVFIDIMKIDVKGVRSDDDKLTVNCKAHYSKDVTHYWFIKPNESDKFEYWFIPSEYISLWNVDETKFTPFFYKYINEL